MANPKLCVSRTAEQQNSRQYLTYKLKHLNAIRYTIGPVNIAKFLKKTYFIDLKRENKTT